MLHLCASTPDHWGTFAVQHLPEILLDHAHCEKKAASTALALAFRHPEHPSMMLPLSRFVREELGHFELVLSWLDRKQVVFRRMRPSSYASRLMTIVRTHEPARLLDTLLCMAMIEARSCERMQALAGALDCVDAELAAGYRSLLASEARHHAFYLELIDTLAVWPQSAWRSRLEDVAQHEASVIADAPVEARLHGGVPPA